MLCIQTVNKTQKFQLILQLQTPKCLVTVGTKPSKTLPERNHFADRRDVNAEWDPAWGKYSPGSSGKNKGQCHSLGEKYWKNA